MLLGFLKSVSCCETCASPRMSKESTKVLIFSEAYNTGLDREAPSASLEHFLKPQEPLMGCAAQRVPTVAMKGSRIILARRRALKCAVSTAAKRLEHEKLQVGWGFGFEVRHGTEWGKTTQGRKDQSIEEVRPWR